MADMTTTTHAYRIDADFLSGGELFASDIISFQIEERADVWTSAYLAAESSTYFDLRIPDLSYSFHFVPSCPDDPAPPAPAGALKPVCKDCGCDMLARDASARWDIQCQAWTISGVYDCTFCDLCSAESDDLARWIPARDLTPFDRFTASLADALPNPQLVSDSVFHMFCVDHALTHTVEDARSAWIDAVARRSCVNGAGRFSDSGDDHA